jgi:hypothetical protein
MFGWKSRRERERLEKAERLIPRILDTIDNNGFYLMPRGFLYSYETPLVMALCRLRDDGKIKQDGFDVSGYEKWGRA